MYYTDKIEQNLISEILNSLPGCIYVCKASEDYPLVFVNENLISMYGYEDKNKFRENRQYLSDLICKEDWKDIQDILKKALENPGNGIQHEYRIPTYSGELIQVFAGMKSMQHEGTIYICGFQMNYQKEFDHRSSLMLANETLVLKNNELISYTENMQKLIDYDSLSGLYNRGAAEKFINTKLQVDPGQYGLLMIDLDYFKLINDTYGHTVGDQVIQQLGLILKKSSRQGDVAARIGGDEFCLFLNKIPDEETLNAVSKRILFQVKQFSTEIPCFTVSIGGALAEPNDTYHTLSSRADKALYQVKENGRDNIAIYVEE